MIVMWLPRWAVWLAGFVVILAGIACLVLSDGIIHGWWQGTFQAIGVGFIVGGLVDIMAISAVTHLSGEDATQRDLQEQTLESAQQLLARVETLETELGNWRRTQGS
jgi:hypothetical protein